MKDALMVAGGVALVLVFLVLASVCCAAFWLVALAFVCGFAVVEAGKALIRAVRGACR